MSIEEYNYWNDPRVIASMEAHVFKVVKVCAKSCVVMFDYGWLIDWSEDGFDFAKELARSLAEEGFDPEDFADRNFFREFKERANDTLEKELGFFRDSSYSDEPNLLRVPFERRICDLCGGSKKVVNPNIDSGGITEECFERDPGFFDDYRSGYYDVKCPRCKGEGMLTTPSLPAYMQRRVDVWLKAQRDFEDLQRSERSMGA